MEHAVRYHIRKHFDEDPAHYAKLSEKLDKILEALKEQWDQLALALSDLVDEALKGRQVDSTGLDPKTEAPFYGLLGQELEAEATATQASLSSQDAPPAELSPAQAAVLRDATVALVAHMRARDRRRRVLAERIRAGASSASGSCSISTASRSTATTCSSWIASPRSPTAWSSWRGPTTRSWWAEHDAVASTHSARRALDRRRTRLRGAALAGTALDRNHRRPRWLADRERSPRLR